MKTYYILSLVILIVDFAFGSVVESKVLNETPIAEVSWLQKHLKDDNLLVIDVRKEEAYLKGHVQGAVNMPVMKDFFTPKMLMFPKLDILKERFSEVGIDDNTQVVVYDNGQFCWAARAYWVLKVLGHEKVKLLRYGYGAYLQKHLPISTKQPTRKRKSFIIRINNQMIETKLGVLMAIGKKPILDGRTEDMYMGRTSIAKRYGHIPTAKLFSGSNNYRITEEGNKLKSFNELKKVYEGLPKDQTSIIYCQDGADAALDYIMMKELGYKSIVYEGSWLEWGNDDNTPIENPSAKDVKKK